VNVLVIGGAGYIGSHVVQALLAGGNRVTVFDNLSSGLRENLFSDAAFIHGDIMRPAQLRHALSDSIEAVVHLAAFKAAGESMVVPWKYAENNLSGTINIINAMIETGVKRLVFSSSAAVYGEPRYLPIDESHPQVPENFYGFTKLEIERILEWYDRLAGLRFAALRYFNAAGASAERGEDHAPEYHLIPLCCKWRWGNGPASKFLGMITSPATAPVCAITSTYLIWPKL